MTCVAFCKRCGKIVMYGKVATEEWATVKGTRFSFDEVSARCLECGEEVYVATINDWNVRAREQAYFRALESSREKK